MSTPLFDTAPKQVTDTSLKAYGEIEPTLTLLEFRVLVWLQISAQYCGASPTAYELFDEMRRAGMASDLNAVRPRLTALEAKHVIAKGAKRACRITGRTAYTWEIRS